MRQLSSSPWRVESREGNTPLHTADMNLRCHVLYTFLLEKFPGRVACTVLDIATIIQESETLLPQNPDSLIPLISTLSDKGLLLLVKDSVSSEDSWVILQKQVLLAEINGTKSTTSSQL